VLDRLGYGSGARSRYRLSDGSHRDTGGVMARLTRGNGSTARLSLARTAKLVVEHPADLEEAPIAAETDSDRSPHIELTDWGKAQRLVPPAEISNAPMQWDFPARNLGSGAPHWSRE
jgi:hypothetical protein